MAVTSRISSSNTYIAQTATAAGDLSILYLLPLTIAISNVQPVPNRQSFPELHANIARRYRIPDT